MLGRWWRARRIERVLARRAIPDALWNATLAAYPFIAHRCSADRERLRTLATVFLADKEFTGANGLVITDAMAVAIAAQACLPVLEIGLGLYARTVGIVVQPGEVLARRHVTDEDTGLVHEYDEVLAGEAMEGGPVMLSWQDVHAAGTSADAGYNVVVHEFVHLIDMADGIADAMPPLPDAAARRHWALVIEAAYTRFCRTLEAGQDTFLDPYGAEAIEEFFPVAAEAFFVAPEALRAEQPQLYELFVGYFRQDPARR
ncbi:MAG TPA: M90 family metallopeptidase [Methylibium sp.]|nr:M90 family metallopeptidase [Methylibium sp.]